MKICSKCKIEKTESEFRPQRTVCKKCIAIDRKKKEGNKEKKEKLSNDELRRRAVVRAKRWAVLNREKSREIKKRWRDKNPKKQLQSQYAWKKKHPERVKKQKQKDDSVYKKNHWTKILAKKRDYEKKERILIKPSYAIRRLKRHGFPKEIIKSVPDLIDIKTLQIKNTRVIKQLQYGN